jgi:hypothetical protein
MKKRRCILKEATKLQVLTNFAALLPQVLQGA